MTRPGYRVVEHTADAAIEAYGATMEQVFEHAAAGMFALMFSRPSGHPSETHTVELSAESVEDLLVAWLSDLLAESEIAGVAFCEFGVRRLGPASIGAAAGGVPVSQVEQAGPPIKAVTYHDLAVARTDDGWRAHLVFDV